MVTALRPRVLVIRSSASVRERRRSSWSTRFGTAPSCRIPWFCDTTVSRKGVGMTIRTARNGELELAYEVLGEPGGEPLLLIMGLGAQMVGWPDGFCRGLTARGFTVLRFDNRDVGLSTHLDVPPGRRGRPPYTLSDMAGDALAVL